MATDKNKHLKCVLESHRMKHVESLVSLYKKKREDIANALYEKYSDKLYLIINSGSYAKFTAINKKFDWDMCTPFISNAFDTLEKMFNSIYDYFNEEYRKKDTDLTIIKKQKVSIGLTFQLYVEQKYYNLNFDVVPGREIDNYEKDKNINLYINDDWGILEKKKSIKTNIAKHVETIEGKTKEREIVKLLKAGKKNYPNMKSFLLELLTIKAFENAENIPNDLWPKLEMVMIYIRDNIETISIVDPSNSNNIISDTLNETEKSVIKSTFENMIKNINEHEDTIKSYFTENTEFPCQSTEKAVYGVKENKPSSLPIAPFA